MANYIQCTCQTVRKGRVTWLVVGLVIWPCTTLTLPGVASPRQSPSHHDGQMSTAVAPVRAFSRAAAVPATAARASSRATRLPVRAAASTMSAPMKSGEAAALPYTIAPPAHPTYSIADAIKLALEEDIADIGDISSLST